jgi:uncharacterized damage-inducible protein DinB
MALTMTSLDPRYADPRLRELDPRPDPIAPALGAARGAFARATERFLSVPDEALEREWPWTADGETDVRSGFYVALERLQQARGGVERALVQADVVPGPAWAALAAATEGRWELHGSIASLEDGILDADPGGGAWSVRGTLAHVVESQRGYEWFSAWWVGRRGEQDLPAHAPEELDEDLPSPQEQGSGSLGQVRRRLDALVDLGIGLWLDADDDTLAIRARWMGVPVTVGFRLGRWAAHIEEHTVQIDKTLVSLDRPPSEVARLVRLLHRAFGRLEGATPMLVAGRDHDGAAAAIGSAAREVERIAGQVAQVAKGSEVEQGSQ